MRLLEFKNIKKRFGTNEVLSDISFNIKEGEILGLVGGSGCGKSTFLNVLIGILRPDYGGISFEGKNALKKLDYLRKKTGFATQGNMLFDELTIRENSLYFGELYGMKRKYIKIRINDLIPLMGLEGFENVQIKHLSGGMAKRANLLVSLIHNPKLLILDEPTVGLDSFLRNALWAYIRKINKEGITILVTSHLLDEIEGNCDRVAVLKNGKIVAIGSISAYRKIYGNVPFSAVFENILKNENI